MRVHLSYPHFGRNKVSAHFGWQIPEQLDSRLAEALNFWTRFAGLQSVFLYWIASVGTGEVLSSGWSATAVGTAALPSAATLCGASMG